MSLTALRQAAFGARSIYPIGNATEAKSTEKGRSEASADRLQSDATKPPVTLEPHWQAAIESATD